MMTNKPADPCAVPDQEFTSGPRPPELGHPETDPPFTVRIEPPWTWERRMDPLTPRVVKLDPPGSFPVCWAVYDPAEKLLDGETNLSWRNHDEVRDWPIQHFLGVTAAMRSLEQPADAR